MLSRTIEPMVINCRELVLSKRSKPLHIGSIIGAESD